MKPTDKDEETDPTNFLIIGVSSGVMALITTGIEIKMLSGSPVLLATLLICKLWMFIGVLLCYFVKKRKKGGNL